ncbi:hypothetical protein ACFOEW_16990 [Alteromonas oceani]|uniref:Uncharacterized protein n=1 Tax=Alteromonas oceani TaxID=2071609 RepID=A0ABV7JZN2_9ALTE|nr:hypothetical protein [Alteromonas oceani]
MRQFTPHPDLVKAISSFGETPFRVTMLRDRYLELFSTNRTKNEVRRWAHSFMRTFVKHGLLIELNGTEYNVAHYMATEKLLGERGTEQSGSKDVSPLYNYASEIQKRLQARQKDILISLGATEELESLRKEFPEMASRIDSKLHDLREDNVRTLGKIKALETLLATHS